MYEITLQDMLKRIEKLEVAVFPEPENVPTIAKDPDDGYGACGEKGHPQTSHLCQTGGVPLSPQHFKDFEAARNEDSKSAK